MSLNAHDVLAEQSLLGAMIDNSASVTTPFLAVPPQAYYAQKHQALAHVMRDMVAKKIGVDLSTVVSQLMDQGLVGRIDPTYVHQLKSMAAVTANADYYADRICELYGRRELSERLTRVNQRLDAAWTSGETQFLGDAIQEVRRTLEEINDLAGCASTMTVTYLDEFLATPVSYSWLVPGLLEKADRLVLTGEEGFGKSELISQLACTMAAGVHPFTGGLLDQDPLRVAVVDCENSPMQSKRRYRRIVAGVDRCREDECANEMTWSKQLAIEFRPGGLNLLNGTDIAWLDRFVSATTPDVLVIGPLYKLHREDMNAEAPARALTAALDDIRERHGVAIISEAHAGKKEGDGGRNMAPRGSSLFLGWPEFGLGLRRSKEDRDFIADVVSWRGARDERQWPQKLSRSTNGRLSWIDGSPERQAWNTDWDKL